MKQPTFGNVRQGKMRGPMFRRLTNWRKHMLYGGAGALGAGAAMLMNTLDDRPANDLPGPRSPAFYGHRYSHLLPHGVYETAMRQGTARQTAGFVPIRQRAAAGFAP